MPIIPDWYIYIKIIICIVSEIKLPRMRSKVKYDQLVMTELQKYVH